MNWFSKLVHIDHEERRDLVYKKISENEGIGLNDLFELLRKEKTSMAKSTLVKVVNELRDDDMVAKSKAMHKQAIRLTTRIGLARSEDNLIAHFKSLTEDFEAHCTDIDAMIGVVSDIEMAREIAKLAHTFGYLQWLLAALRAMTRNRLFEHYSNELVRLRNRLADITEKSPPEERWRLILLVNKVVEREFKIVHNRSKPQRKRTS